MVSAAEHVDLYAIFQFCEDYSAKNRKVFEIIMVCLLGVWVSLAVYFTTNFEAFLGGFIGVFLTLIQHVE